MVNQKGLLMAVILLISAVFALQAQEFPINEKQFLGDNNSRLKDLYQPGNGFHTSIRPFLHDEVSKIFNGDSLDKSLHFTSPFSSRFYSWVWNKAFNEDLASLNTELLSLRINPLIGFEMGKENGSDEIRWLNARGIRMEGRLGQNIGFATTFIENQSNPFTYERMRIQQIGVMPGEGGIKGFKETNYDYAWSSGYVSYNPTSYLNFQFGQGKHFIGDGYRSLLLSDEAFNYPYFQFTVNVWKLKYMSMVAQFTDPSSPSIADLGYPKKYGTFHYLSIFAGKRLNIGLFESIIWKAADSSNYRGLELAYLNPVIFLRPVEFSVGSPDNALMGLNISYRFSASYMMYGQLMLDEMKFKEVMNGNGWWGNKQAVQIGFRYFDLAGLKGLNLLSEFNYARPYMYSHRSNLQNYGHYNEALAHPLGANFRESISILSYQHKRFFCDLKMQYAEFGADSAGINYGGNIFKPYDDHPFDYGNTTTQGDLNKLYRAEVRLMYLINPAMNLNAVVGYIYRNQESDQVNRKDNIIYFGLRTSVFNRYKDF